MDLGKQCLPFLVGDATVANNMFSIILADVTSEEIRTAAFFSKTAASLSSSKYHRSGPCMVSDGNYGLTLATDISRPGFYAGGVTLSHYCFQEL